jgi:adenylyltransferase/sulfurtransferase
VGFLRIVDRDIVELNNLQRQQLFDEKDVQDRLPKAVAACRKLRRINSEIRIEQEIADVTYANVERLIRDVDLVVDGTDNFETRLLLNDACLKAGRPWAYAGTVAAHGMTMLIVPGRTGCFRCFVGSVPDPEHTQTCDTAGILNAASNAVASLQTAQALRFLTTGEVDGRLITVDVWSMRLESFLMKSVEGCPGCAGRYEYLQSRKGTLAVTLCGRSAVQVSTIPEQKIDLALLEKKIPGAVRNEFLLRFEADGHAVTLFPDARAIVHGTDDPARARTLYARYIGS